METVLIDGDVIEIQNKSSPPDLAVSEKNMYRTDFTNALLFAGGRVENSSLFYYHHLEGFVFWIKECLEILEIKGAVKNTFKGFIGKPAVWSYSSEPCLDLSHIENNWYKHIKGTMRKVVPDFEKTPLVAFIWYLIEGVYAEFKGCKHLLLGKQQEIKKLLNEINITVPNSRFKDIRIFEPDYKKFFSYICEVPFLIPECFCYKFPNEYIQYNRDWVLTHNLK